MAPHKIFTIFLKRKNPHYFPESFIETTKLDILNQFFKQKTFFTLQNHINQTKSTSVFKPSSILIKYHTSPQQYTKPKTSLLSQKLFVPRPIFIARTANKTIFNYSLLFGKCTCRQLKYIIWKFKTKMSSHGDCL